MTTTPALSLTRSPYRCPVCHAPAWSWSADDPHGTYVYCRRCDYISDTTDRVTVDRTAGTFTY